MIVVWQIRAFHWNFFHISIGFQGTLKNKRIFVHWNRPYLSSSPDFHPQKFPPWYSWQVAPRLCLIPSSDWECLTCRDGPEHFSLIYWLVWVLSFQSEQMQWLPSTHVRAKSENSFPYLSECMSWKVGSVLTLLTASPASSKSDTQGKGLGWGERIV